MNEECFLRNFTDFIFVEDQPEEADAIFVPGNGWPQMAIHAAGLWKQGMAPWVVPSGRYSITRGKFGGVQAMRGRYRGYYETEWAFLFEVLRQEGIPPEVILKEDQAQYTYQNALLSREATDRAGISVRKGLLCCQSHHARRCRMYYQLAYPETEWKILPSDTEVSRDNWFLSERGIKLVLGEMERCGTQFHEILKTVGRKRMQKNPLTDKAEKKTERTGGSGEYMKS